MIIVYRTQQSGVCKIKTITKIKAPAAGWARTIKEAKNIKASFFCLSYKAYVIVLV